MSYKKLLQQRIDLRNAMATLMEKAKGRATTGAERDEYEALEAKLLRVGASIDTEEMNFNNGNPIPPARLPGGPSGFGGGGRTSSSRYTGNLDDGGWKDGIHEILYALARRSKGEGMDPRLVPMASGINEGVGSEGGFVVPDQYTEKIFSDEMSDGSTPLLDACDRAVMTTNSISIPSFDDSTHATAPYGIHWAPIAEGGSFGGIQTLPFRKIGMVAKKIGALFSCSNEWMQDTSAQMRARVEAIFTKSLRWKICDLMWSGIGAGVPLGALNANATLSIPKEVGQDADSVVTENIVQMWSRLLPGSHSRAFWACNPSCFPQLATLQIGVGTGGIVVSVLQTGGASGIAGSPSTAIFGRPLVLSEHLPALGDSGDICLIDPSLYVMGDRRQIIVDASQHLKFDEDLTVFRASVRLDAQPVLANVRQPKNGPSAAWCVKIAARA